jgi:cyclophilin family peptidyl-prolyl cis-trans isomerase
MMRRIFCATAIALLSTAGLSAQTIRFDTNVGTFDMVLNPTGNPFLQNHVDNIIAYTESGRYDLTVINRAATNFVLQMGGFQAPFLTLPSNFSAFPSVAADDPVIVDANRDGTIDFDIGNLSNTRATVSLALSSNNANSGTSSFFINLNDSNNFLDDSNFIPFAEIRNMETVNLIMSLPQANLDSSGSNLAAINIPILEDNKLVIIERAFVLDATEEMIAAALANATPSVGPVALDPNDDPPLDDPGGLLIVPTIPEPSTVILASAMAMLSLLRRR